MGAWEAGASAATRAASRCSASRSAAAFSAAACSAAAFSAAAFSAAAVRAQLGEQPQRMESDLDGVDAVPVASVGTALVIEPVVVLVHERVAPLVMRAVPEEAVRAPLAV